MHYESWIKLMRHLKVILFMIEWVYIIVIMCFFIDCLQIAPLNVSISLYSVITVKLYKATFNIA
jgi:hypothetical protein